MATASEALLSLEEFLSMPNEPGKQELLDGELISLPPAKLRHMTVSKRIYGLLRTAVDDDQVWFETGYQLGDSSMLQPDLSVNWPNQHIANDYMQGAPMIAVEIASRGNTADEIEGKIRKYLDGGAAEVWVIYPKRRSMTVDTASQRRRVTGLYECETLGLSINLAELF